MTGLYGEFTWFIWYNAFRDDYVDENSNDEDWQDQQNDHNDQSDCFSWLNNNIKKKSNNFIWMFHA